MAGLVLLCGSPLGLMAQGDTTKKTEAAQPHLSAGLSEVVKLSHAKLSDEAIVAFVRNSRARYTMSASDIVFMHEDGVSDRVITAMLDKERDQPAIPEAAPVAASTPASSAPAVAPQSSTVVVQQQPTVVQAAPTYVSPQPVYLYSAPPAVVYEPYPYYRPYYGYPVPALSFSFGFGRGYHGGGFHGRHR